MPFCTECGSKHEAGDRFCASCGQRLEVMEAVTTPGQGSHPVPHGMEYGAKFNPSVHCFNCGTRGNARSKVCRICGVEDPMSA